MRMTAKRSLHFDCMLLNLGSRVSCTPRQHRHIKSKLVSVAMQHYRLARMPQHPPDSRHIHYHALILEIILLMCCNTINMQSCKVDVFVAGHFWMK